MTSRTPLALLLAVTALAAAAPAAQAGPIVESAGNCAEQPMDRTFLPWADIANYTPLPGGDFEAAPRGWRLEDGARVVPGNERFQVGGAKDARSLAVPAGSSVTSASICVGLEHPTMRFFLRRTDGAATATLLVEVLFEDAEGRVHALPVSVLPATSEWEASPLVPVVANLLPLLPGERTAVAFRFTPVGGSFQVDDVYVDPWCRR